MLQKDGDSFLSLAALAEARVNEYKVKIEGVDVILEEHRVVGDGDCGFHALGVSRDEFTRVIVESKEIKDRANKAIIGKLVQGLFLNGQITEALPVWNGLVTQWRELFNSEQSIKDSILGFVEELESCGVNLDCKGEYNEILDERISRLTGGDKSRLVAYKSDLKKAERSLDDFFFQDDLIGLYYTNALKPDTDNNQGLGLWLDIPSILIYAKIKRITIRVWEKIGNNLRIKDSHIQSGSEQQKDIVFVNNNHFNFLLRQAVNEESDAEIKEESDAEIIDEDYALPRFQLQDLKNEKIVLLDVDETLVMSNRFYGQDDGGYRYNKSLINNLKQAGLTRVYLFTSYKLKDIAKTKQEELVGVPSRYKLVNHLSSKGFEVLGVCTVLDSVYNQGVGSYYEDKIKKYEGLMDAGADLTKEVDYKKELIKEREIVQNTNKAILYEYIIDTLGQKNIAGVLLADDMKSHVNLIKDKQSKYDFPLETILVKPHDVDYSENIINFQKAAYWHSIKKPLIYNHPQLDFLREEKKALMLHYEQMLKQEGILGAKLLRQKIIKWQQDIRATGVDYLNLKIESLNEERGSFQLISQSGAEINVSVDVYKKIIKKVNNQGNSSVGYHKGVFYKQLLSSCAIREQVVYEVSQLLGCNLVTPTTVLKINLAEHQKVPILSEQRHKIILDEIRKLAKDKETLFRLSIIMQKLRFDAEVSNIVLDYLGFSCSSSLTYKLNSLIPEEDRLDTVKEWCRKIDLVPNELTLQASLIAGQISLDKLLRIPKAVRWLEKILGREATIKLLPDLLNNGYRKAREDLSNIKDEFRRNVAKWDAHSSYSQVNFTESQFDIVKIEDILDLLEHVPTFRSQDLFELISVIDVIRNITIVYKNKSAEYIVDNVSRIPDNFDIDNLIAHGLLDLITSPTDHKGDNYRVIVKYDEDGNLLPFKIIAIDNDEALGRSLSFGVFKQVVTQSVILCLLMKNNYKDKIIPPHLRNHLANLDVSKFMLQLRLSEKLKERFILEAASIRWSEVESTLTKLKDACVNDVSWLDLFLKVKPVTSLLYQQLAIDNNCDADWMIHNLMDRGIDTSIDGYLLPKLSIVEQRKVEVLLKELNSNISRVRDGAIELDLNLGNVTQELLLVLSRYGRGKLALNIKIKDFIVVYNKMKNNLLDIIDIPKSRLILASRRKVEINTAELLSNFVREETFNVFSIIQYISNLSLPDMMTQHCKSESLEIISRLLDLGGGEHLPFHAANRLHVRLKSCEPCLSAELLHQNAKLKWQFALGELLEDMDSNWQVQVLSLIESAKKLKEKYREELYPNNEFKREHANGKSPGCVLRLSNNIKIYIKQKPLLPGRAIQVDELANLLFERITAKVGFYKFIEKTIKSNKFIEKTIKSKWRSQPEFLEYPVMVSEYIEGFTLDKIADNPIELAKITQSSFSKAFILALLINPEDGRGDNYMLSSREKGSEVVYDIISIDNDQAFVEPLSYKGGRVDPSANGMQVKSIIYCLENMKYKLDADVINKILDLDPHSLVKAWLERLHDHEKRSRPLFPQKISKESVPDENRFTTKIYEARVSDIYGRLTRLKKLLGKNKEITALSIFKDLMPGLASRYEDAINNYKLPSERFRKLTPGQFNISVDSKGRKISSSKRNEKEMAKMSRPLTLDEKTEMVSPKDAISFLNETISLDRIQQLIKRGRVTLFKKMERTQQEEVVNGNESGLSALNFSQFSVGNSNTLLQALGLIDLRNVELINVKSSQDYLKTIMKHSHAMKRLLIDKYKNADKWLLNDLSENLSQLEVLWIKNQPKLTDHDYVIKRYISPFQNLKELTLDSLSNLLTLDISIPNIEKLVLINLPKLTQVFKNQRGVVLTKLKTLKLKNLATLDSLDFKAKGLEVLEIERAPKLSVDRFVSIPNIEKLVLINLPKLTQLFKNKRRVVLTKLKTLRLKNLATLDSLDFKAKGLEVLEIERAPKLSVDRLLSFIEGTKSLKSIIVDRASEKIKHLAASLYQIGSYIEKDEKQAEIYFNQLPDSKKYKDYLQGRFVTPLDKVLLDLNIRIGAYKRIILSGLGISSAEVKGLAALLEYENNGVKSIDLSDNKLSAHGRALLKKAIDVKHNEQVCIKIGPLYYIFNDNKVIDNKAIDQLLKQNTCWGNGYMVDIVRINPYLQIKCSYNKELLIGQLLKYTDGRKQDKVEGIVRMNPSLLSIKGKGPQFKGVTAFQYAYLACDGDMLRMMRRYMDTAERLRQEKELEQEGFRQAAVIEHDQKSNIEHDQESNWSLIALTGRSFAV